MSFQAMAWAAEQKLQLKEKMVLLMLANHTNHHNGRCDPSLSRLAEECGTSRDSVIRAIKTLEELGYLVIIRRVHDGVSLSNSYKLRLPGLPEENCDIDLIPVQGVVAECDQGSRSVRRGVVAGCDTKQEVEPVNKPTPTPQPVGFDAFWSAYPSKVAKPAALKAFKKINPNPETLKLMLAKLKLHVASERWQKDKGQFIPNPATWLNQRRWEDEGRASDRVEDSPFRGAK